MIKKIVLFLLVCLLGVNALAVDLAPANKDVVHATDGVLGDGTTWWGKEGIVANANRVYVMAFQLPVLSGGEYVETASFQCEWQGYGEEPGNGYHPAVETAADLYGIDSRVASTVVAGDYYVGYFSGSAGDTAIQSDVFASSDPNELSDGPATPTSTSSDGNMRLACYIKAQYDGGATGGTDHIFLRFNHRQDHGENYLQQYIMEPKIVYTISGTPPTGCQPSALAAIELCADSFLSDDDEDLNDDCMVNVEDLAIAAENWLAPSSVVY